jgi:hypothetical protein
MPNVSTPAALSAISIVPIWAMARRQKGHHTPGKSASDVIANPSFYLVAGARNHLQANRSLAFQFEVTL